MDTLLQFYKQECAKIRFLENFKTIGSNHYRVINDVVQAFNLERTRGNSCTLEIGVTPLCFGIIDKKNIIESLRAVYFSRDWSREYWEYERGSLQSFSVCVQDIVALIREVVVPFFMRSADCINAYDAITKLLADCSFLFNEPQLFCNYSSYCMLVKAKNYDAAISHLQHSKACWETDDPDLLEMDRTPEYYAMKNRRLAGIKRELDILQSGNDDLISDFVSKREQLSLQTYGLLSKDVVVNAMPKPWE